MEKNSKIYIAGHRGLVGSAIIRQLENFGYTNIVTREFAELDLTSQKSTEEFFAKERPDYVILAAAKVGGILANSTYPADFIYQNLMISTNVIHASYKSGVKKLLNLGSSCIYPRLAPQPMKEDCLLTSELESTNEAYAIAKIAAIKLCRYYNEQYGTNFISLMPTNQYGKFDNFNMETAHLLPMLLRRFHLAKLLLEGDFESIKKDLKANKLGSGLDEKIDYDNNDSIEKILNEIGAYKDKVTVWGDGSVYRELMSSDDLADACVYLMNNKDAKEIGELVNITDGTDIQLKELFGIVKDIVGFEGKIEYDTTKPNGTPRKLMDATKIKSLGWNPKISLNEGIKSAYEWYVKRENCSNAQKPPRYVKLGRYSYLDGTRIMHPDTEIGKFCSVARNVIIGPSQHPVNFLSSHPFQYARQFINSDFKNVNFDSDKFVSTLPFKSMGEHSDYETSEFKSCKPCKVGNDVWIGANAVIMDGITISDGAIIAAGAIVTEDVPPYAIVGGVPAKIIKHRFSKDIIDSLLKLKWWDLPDEDIFSLPFDDIEKCVEILKEKRN